MKKIPRTAKVGPRGRPIWQSEEFFEFNSFQIGQHVVLLLVNYIICIVSRKVHPKSIFLRNVHTKTIQINNLIGQFEKYDNNTIGACMGL